MIEVDFMTAQNPPMLPARQMTYIPIYTCTLQNAFPTTISSIELSNASENAIAKVNVTMSYDDWSDSASLAGTLVGIAANKLFG